MEPAIFGHRGQVGYGLSRSTVVYTSIEIDVAMNFKRAFRTVSRSAMKSIHVLGDQSESILQVLFQLDQVQMCGVWVCFSAALSTPEIPRPYQLWIGRKSGPGGQLLGLINATSVGPKPFRSAKGGNAALCTDSSTGQKQKPSVCWKYRPKFSPVVQQDPQRLLPLTMSV